jgi:hypothetical protein
LTELATNFAGMGCGMTDTGGPGAAGWNWWKTQGFPDWSRQCVASSWRE